MTAIKSDRPPAAPPHQATHQATPHQDPKPQTRRKCGSIARKDVLYDRPAPQPIRRLKTIVAEKTGHETHVRLPAYRSSGDVMQGTADAYDIVDSLPDYLPLFC